MAIAAQQHAEIVKPSHNALQFNTVDQENRQGNLVFADIIEKCVLQILSFFSRHVVVPTLFLAVARAGLM